MAQVLLRGVTKRYGGDGLVLAGVDLTVHDGEVFAVIGPSGAGKSTLLRVVVGLEAPTEGTVIIGEREVTDLAPNIRNVSFVAQSGALFPHLSVEGNLRFPLRQRGTDRSRIALAIDRTARAFGLLPLLSRRPPTLSRGEQQEVAIGRAAIRSVDALVLDEPMSDVDPVSRREVAQAIRAHHAAYGTTMLLATNDQAEAMSLAHRLAVLVDGRIHQVGAPQHVYERPATTAVATFLGDPGMNLLHGELGSGAQGPVLRVGAHLLAVGAAPGGRTRDHAVTVGVRPEHLRLGSAVIPDESLPGAVRLVERLGPRSLVHVAVADGGGAGFGPVDLVVSAGADCRAQRGDQVAVAVAADRLHWFDPASGARLGP